MADKAIGELIAAEKVNQSDLFVLEQDGAAKKLPAQILENWLLAMAQGHGGIQSIDKVGTSGLVDTYRITLADTSYFDFPVTNGKSIADVRKSGTAGLVDTYTIGYNDGSTSSFSITNGAKGDKGDNTYTWIKYASQEPTESSHSMGDIPDDWRGEYNGPLAAAPTDWKQYKWFKIKGEKGDIGIPATLVSTEIVYQSSDSGTIVPSGAWSTSIPVVAQGKYLWKRTTRKFNSGEPEVSYDVNRMGMDGSGSVSSVAGVSPDSTGNVILTATDVGALPSAGGDMTGAINMNGQPISGLNDPTEDTQAARKGYVDAAKTAANAYTDAAVRKAAPRNLLDNSDFRNPVNQRGIYSAVSGAYIIDRWVFANSNLAGNMTIALSANGITVTNDAGADRVAIAQRFIDKNYYSGKYTAVAKTTDGLLFGYTELVDAENSISQVTFWLSSGTTVVWAALYEGEYTAETLPEYQPKGYGAELAECQRYYQIRSANNIAAVDMRPTMRLSSPTITSVTGGYAYSADL